MVDQWSELERARIYVEYVASNEVACPIDGSSLDIVKAQDVDRRVRAMTFSCPTCHRSLVVAIHS
jgi:hypothetical protein